MNVLKSHAKKIAEFVKILRCILGNKWIQNFEFLQQITVFHSTNNFGQLRYKNIIEKVYFYKQFSKLENIFEKCIKSTLIVYVDDWAVQVFSWVVLWVIPQDSAIFFTYQYVNRHDKNAKIIDYQIFDFENKRCFSHDVFGRFWRQTSISVYDDVYICSQRTNGRPQITAILFQHPPTKRIGHSRFNLCVNSSRFSRPSYDFFFRPHTL